MAEVVDELRIEGSTSDVWAVLADFGSISRWASNVDHSCLMTLQATGTGAVRRVQVGRNALLEKVVTWEPEVALGYELIGVPPLVRTVTNTWSISAEGGTTAVKLTTQIEPAGPRPPQQLAARIFGRVLARASGQLLAGLKAYVEESNA